MVDKLISGLTEFKKTDFESHKELFAHLADGQQPEALLITCSDSRIDPNMITQTKPGDIFISRNAGNIVPPYIDVEHSGGITASIEFAVKALGVEHIIICGHTDCGAMKGAMNPDSLKTLPHVSMWLGFCAEALNTLHSRHEHVCEEDHLREMTEENIKQQLTHLASHPSVAERLAADNIQLHGWLYDIAEGTVSCLDDQTGKFVSVEDRYASILHAGSEGSA